MSIIGECQRVEDRHYLHLDSQEGEFVYAVLLGSADRLVCEGPSLHNEIFSCRLMSGLDGSRWWFFLPYEAGSRPGMILQQKFGKVALHHYQLASVVTQTIEPRDDQWEASRLLASELHRRDLDSDSDMLADLKILMCDPLEDD